MTIAELQKKLPPGTRARIKTWVPHVPDDLWNGEKWVCASGASTNMNGSLGLLLASELVLIYYPGMPEPFVNIRHKYMIYGMLGEYVTAEAAKRAWLDAKLKQLIEEGPVEVSESKDGQVDWDALIADHDAKRFAELEKAEGKLADIGDTLYRCTTHDSNTVYVIASSIADAARKEPGAVKIEFMAGPGVLVM